MDDRQIDDFLRAILTTERHEIDCAEFMDIIAQYVDAEIASEGPPGDPRVPRHIDLCPDCADMYRSLKFVAALEAQGDLPAADQLWRELAEAARQAGAVPAAAAAAAAATEAVKPEADGALANGERRLPGRKAPSKGAAPDSSTPVSSQADRNGRGSWLSGWGRSNLAWAGAAALIVFLAVGWWRSYDHVQELEAALYWIGHTEQVSFNKADDGSWARVLYSPSEERFFVVAGDMPKKSLRKRIKCALIKKNGEEMIAGEFTVDADSQDWWLLDAGEPLSTFESLRISDGEKDSIIQVQLAARD